MCSSDLLRTLAAPLDRLRVVIDGRGYEATWAVITNARHFGGSFVLSPDMHLRRSGLQAVLFRSRSRSHLMSQLARIALGRHRSRPPAGTSDVHFVDCAQAHIDADHAIPVQIDGDDFQATPLSVRTGGGRVNLIVPGGGAS